MNFDFDKITPCSGDCSGCRHFLDKECEGCLKTDGKCVKMWEKGCSIYDCCKKNSVKFCGLCANFPCEDFYKIAQWDKDALERHKEAAEKYREAQARSDVYKTCPSFENESFLIRRTEKGDKEDLLKVYSDIKSVPFFNGDNCHGDDFHYTTMERMEQALDFWEMSYRERWFVRFSIIGKNSGNTGGKTETIGTVELFKRASDDKFNGCGVLRLDLRSDFEREKDIFDILALIIPSAYGLFYCDTIITKAVPEASERIAALEKYGFVKSTDKLVGDDGTEYQDYYRIEVKNTSAHMLS